jgi:putative endonuclease
MYTTYIIQSLVDYRFYYGYTEQDISDRLDQHNQGRSHHTSKYKPWKLVWYGTFSSKKQAQDFEKYLKTPSGHAFSRKRLI